MSLIKLRLAGGVRPPRRLSTLAIGAALLLAAPSLHAQANCGNTSVGLVPLTDLGQGVYQGFPGGLYPSGSSTLPAAHRTAGEDVAFRQVLPRDPSGNVDLTNGWIGCASLGMSNTAQEFHQVLLLAQGDPELRSRMVLVNGAHGGQTLREWRNPADPIWDTFAADLQAAGLGPAQLQVVWMKLVERAADVPGSFPGRALVVTDWLRDTVHNLKEKYPSVRMVFLTSRIYAGYASGPLHPEPYAYEHGFSVKWLIEEQISNDPSLAFTGPGTVAPWLAWGPYLWADGLGGDGVVGGVPGRSDGLEWECSDYQSDGTHPSDPQGRRKVAQLWLDWFKTEPLATAWFRSDSVLAVQGTAPDVSAAPGDSDVPVLAFALAVDANDEARDLSSLLLQASGDGNDRTEVAAVRLYRDASGNAAVDAADTLLGSGTFAADDGTLALVLNGPLRLPPGSVTSFLVAYDLAAAAASASLSGLALLLVILLPAPWIARRGGAALRRAALLALVTLCFLPSCSGSGGGDSRRPNQQVTFTASVGSLGLAGAGSGQPAFVPNLPLRGATLSASF